MATKQKTQHTVNMTIKKQKMVTKDKKAKTSQSIEQYNNCKERKNYHKDTLWPQRDSKQLKQEEVK